MAHAQQIVFAAEAGRFNRLDQLRSGIRAQVLVGARLATPEHFHDGVVNMLRGDGLHRLAIQSVALQTGRHALQVTGGAGMQPERHFQLIALEKLGVQRQQVLENA